MSPCLSDSPGILQFEVCPLSDSCFSVSFQHPVNDSLVCGKWNQEEQECVYGKGGKVSFHCNQDFDVFQPSPLL